MISKRTNVKGLGIVAQSDGNLYTNAKDLKGRIISIEDEARARIQTAGKENIGETEGTRAAVELTYIKNDIPVAVKYDKLSQTIAKRAVEANSKNKYLCTNSTERYDINRKIADKEEKSGIPDIERTAIVLPRDDFNMSPLENSSQFNFFFEDMAEEEGKNSYFNLNKKVPVHVYLINKSITDGKKGSDVLENLNGTIIVPYMWFGGLDARSELGGVGRLAGDCGNGARGVLGAPKASQKISQVLPYNPKQIDKYLQLVQEVKAGNKPNSRLGKLEEFLASLKQ